MEIVSEENEEVTETSDDRGGGRERRVARGRVRGGEQVKGKSLITFISVLKLLYRDVINHSLKKRGKYMS